MESGGYEIKAGLLTADRLVEETGLKAVGPSEVLKALAEAARVAVIRSFMVVDFINR